MGIWPQLAQDRFILTINTTVCPRSSQQETLTQKASHRAPQIDQAQSCRTYIRKQAKPFRCYSSQRKVFAPANAQVHPPAGAAKPRRLGRRVERLVRHAFPPPRRSALSVWQWSLDQRRRAPVCKRNTCRLLLRVLYLRCHRDDSQRRRLRHRL